MIIVIQLIIRSFSQPTNKTVNSTVHSASTGKTDNYRHSAGQKVPALAESEVAAPPLQKPTIKPHFTSSQRTSLRTTFRALTIPSNNTVANYTYAA